MILDRIENSVRYVPLQPGFEQAFEFLHRPDLLTLPEGRHEIVGDRVFALVMRGPARPCENARMETHRNHIDIQYLISGKEILGWRPHSSLKTPDGAYNVESDAQFYAEKPESWISLLPGEFVVFFPEDGHAGMMGEGEIHKITLKILQE